MHPELERLLNLCKASGVRLDAAASPRAPVSFTVGHKMVADFNQARVVLDHSGFFGSPGEGNWRADTNESAVLARALIYVKSQLANVLYPALKGRQFVPVSNEIPTGAEQYSIKTYDYVGTVNVGSKYADDMPRADVLLSETIAKILPLINSYGYNVQELRNSAFIGTSLDAMKAAAARDVHARKQEIITAVGDSAMGFTGIANNASVPLVGGLTGTWSTATDAQIIADINKMFQLVVTQSNQVHQANGLLLGTAAYQIITQKPVGVDMNTTVAKWILANNPYCKFIDQWVQLDLANAGANGPRAICYTKDQTMMQLEIPQEFEQFPVQQRGLEFIVPCHSRMGGVSIRYPKSLVYADGL